MRVLEADHRVAALEGRVLPRGSGAASFDLRNLALWFLWYVDQAGQQEAESALEAFLASEETPVEVALWVIGLRVGVEVGPP